MEEPTYDAICHLFHHDNIHEFCKHYSQLLPTEVLQDASIFSMHHQISPGTKRAILELTIDYIDPLLLIVDIDGLINFDHEISRPRTEVEEWLKAEADFGALSNKLYDSDQDDANLPLPASRQALLTELGTCEYEQFRQLVRSLRIHNEVTEYLDYPVVIGLIERFDRILKDDRLLYSILLSSAICCTLQENLDPPSIETETVIVAVDADAFAKGQINMEDIITMVENNFETIANGTLAASISHGAITDPPETSESVSQSTPSEPSPLSSPSWNMQKASRIMYNRRRNRYLNYWHPDN